MASGIKLPEETVKEIVRDYLAGVPFSQIRQSYHVTDATILYHVKQKNAPLRSERRLTHDQKLVIVYKYLNLNLSTCQLAKEYQVHDETIRRIIHGLGGKIRPYSERNRIGASNRRPLS
jgi:hypothetical protein